MKYMVVAPDKETLTLDFGYQTQKFKHGTFIYDEKIAKMYPQFFIPIAKQEKKKIEKDVEPTIIKPKKVEKEKPSKKGFPQKKR